jgi:hypothetical protein
MEVVKLAEVAEIDLYWIKPLRRALCSADARRLFPRLHQAEGAPRTRVHQALLHYVLCGLKNMEAPIEPLFAMSVGIK